MSKFDDDMEREFFRKDLEPPKQACCDCGVKTKWVWSHDPDYDGEDEGEWCEEYCWRCSEIQRMKLELSPFIEGLSNAGKLSTEQADRFIEYMLSPKVLLSEDQVKEIRFVRDK